MEQISRVLYPSKCIICREILEEKAADYLCDRCYAIFHRLQTDKLLEKERALTSLKVPVEEVEIEQGNIVSYRIGKIEKVISLFPYRDNYRKSVLRWKYGGIRKYAKAYADLFVNDLNMVYIYNVEAVIPVPLAPLRQRKRGFNQALDLALELGKAAHIPVYDCLRRNRNTKPQSKCTKEERSKNMQGVIEVKKNMELPSVKRVAIIDDIYTTGATAKACVTALQKLEVYKNTIFFLFVVCK